MIREFARMAIILPVIIIGLGLSPLVQADIFLKPHGEKQEKSGDSTPSKPLLYVPLQKDSSKAVQQKQGEKSAVVPYYKKNTTVIVEPPKQYATPVLDPALLDPGGREPNTAEELRLLAEALKAPKLQAMADMQALNQMIAGREIEAYEQRVAMVQAKRDQQRAQGIAMVSAPVKAKAQAPGKAKAVPYTTMGIQKPKKVFSDY